MVGKEIAPPGRRGDGNYALVPVGGEDRLYFLRSLIDRLVPRQPCLLAEGCHRLDQLIHLRIQQRLSIAGLNGFCLIRRTR